MIWREASDGMVKYILISAVILCGSVQAADEPVCSWDFNGTTSDASGANADNLLPGNQGKVRFVTDEELPGVNGQALAIGVNPDDAQYFMASGSVDTQLGASYTIEAWIHPTRIAGQWSRFFLCWSKERSYHFAIHNHQLSLYHAQANHEERVCEVGQMKANYWYHIVAVASRSEEKPEASTLAVYLNGTQVARTTFDGTIFMPKDCAIGLGDSADGASPAYRFHGYVDSLTVWHRALSAEEIEKRCAARADILNQSSRARMFEQMAKDSSRLELAVELERLAREEDLESDVMEVAARLLDDEDMFVRAMAEWAIARKVGRDNNYEEVKWDATSDEVWLKKWLAVTVAERTEMDWCRQAVSLGIYNDAAKLRKSVDEIIERVDRMEQGGSDVSKSLQAIRLEMNGTEDVASLRSLWLKARRTLRPEVFAKASLDFDEIILFSRHAMHYKPNVCGVHTSWSYKPGGDVLVVSGLQDHRSEQPLIGGKLGPGHVHGLDLFFDRSKIVFAWANQPHWPPGFSTRWPRGGNDCYAFELRNTTEPPHLYEMDLENRRIIQLTDHNFWTDVEPVYCPDGTIAFTSDRSAHSPSCDGRMNDLTDHNLYSLSADRERIRRLTNQKDVDMHPHLLENGLIAYLRWEYQERHFWDVHSVWTVKPDGTMSDALFKQHFGTPLSVRDARSIPGTSKMVAIAAGHHCLPKGPVVILDPTVGINEPQGIELLTPGSMPQETGRYKYKKLSADFDWEQDWKNRLVKDGSVRVAGGFFMMPYAVSEKAYLVSYGYGNHEARRYNYQHADVDSNGLGIYLIDSYGNMELIYRNPFHSCYGVLPFKNRPRPPVLPDLVDMQKNYATCVVTDVYEGMDDVERGVVKYIRIAEALPWPIVPGEGVKRWDLSNRWCPVRVIGTVPVEQDGSAHFKVPVADNASVYFQALDENHMEVRRMRSSISFQPGECRSCNGCHETQALPPAPQQGLAARREPDMPQPPSWGSNRQIAFDEIVQPVLDRNCTKCHNATEPPAGLDFSAGRAYRTIIDGGLVSLSPREGDGSVTAAYQYGSHKSRLITKLLEEDSPCTIDLGSDDWITLVTWVDANAPNAAGMWEKRTADGRNWVWSDYQWKDCWTAPEEIPARGDYLQLPENSWRKALESHNTNAR